jgi:hypothetical protein
LSAPVDALPLSAFGPDHAPDAAQEVALVEDHVRVDAVPLFTVLGVAEKLTVGPGALTDTVADCTALPPAPAQVSVNVALALSAPVDALPLSAFGPDHAPEAVHEVALVDDHVRVELSPLATLLGLALKDTVAVGFALTVTVVDCTALPPAPLHDRV